MVTKELIEKFFRKECTVEEHDLVLSYLRTNPEEFEKYFDEQEWEHFEAAEQLDARFSQKLFEKVRRRTLEKRGNVATMFRISAAASIILAIGIGWFLLRGKSTDVVAKTQAVANAVQLNLIERTNNTSKAVAVVLEDGTSVALAPNSTIKFYKPLVVNNRRDVQLIGQASFKVAKDKSKPFTVVADGIATTALGTFFTIKAFDTSNTIRVALHEGKVVVKSSAGFNGKLKKDFYLLPGDEMIYSKNTAMASVRHSAYNRQMVVAANVIGRNSSVKRPEWYKFNSAALNQVFNQLSTYYQVEIYYYPDEVKNRYYSAKLGKEDSLDIILRDIALLNHLKLEKKNGAYYIEKKGR